jgi:hypothetical protein
MSKTVLMKLCRRETCYYFLRDIHRSTEQLSQHLPRVVNIFALHPVTNYAYPGYILSFCNMTTAYAINPGKVGGRPASYPG